MYALWVAQGIPNWLLPYRQEVLSCCVSPAWTVVEFRHVRLSRLTTPFFISVAAAVLVRVGAPPPDNAFLPGVGVKTPV